MSTLEDWEVRSLYTEDTTKGLVKYPQGNPVVRGRASILTTDIEINFYEKSQVNEILPYLIDKSYDFTFESEMGDSFTPDRFTLSIHNIPFASSVTALYKELEKLDYNTGDSNE